MRRGVAGAAWFLLLACGAWIGGAVADEVKKAPDGKPVFEKYKCMGCHSVETQGIKKKQAAEAEKEEGGSVPPDLSGVGVDHTAEWVGKYLQKLEMLEGKKHMKKFKGTDAELTTLAGWLASLKDEAAAKKAKAGRKATPAKTEGAEPAPKTDK